MSYGVELLYSGGGQIFGPGDIGTTVVGTISAQSGVSGSIAFPDLVGVTLQGVAITTAPSNAETQHVHLVSTSYPAGVPTITWTATSTNGNMDTTIYIIAQ